MKTQREEQPLRKSGAAPSREDSSKLRSHWPSKFLVGYFWADSIVPIKGSGAPALR